MYAWRHEVCQAFNASSFCSSSRSDPWHAQFACRLYRDTSLEPRRQLQTSQTMHLRMHLPTAAPRGSIGGPYMVCKEQAVWKRSDPRLSSRRLRLLLSTHSAHSTHPHMLPLLSWASPKRGKAKTRHPTRALSGPPCLSADCRCGLVKTCQAQGPRLILTSEPAPWAQLAPVVTSGIKLRSRLPSSS